MNTVSTHRGHDPQTQGNENLNPIGRLRPARIHSRRHIVEVRLAVILYRRSDSNTRTKSIVLLSLQLCCRTRRDFKDERVELT